MKKIKLIRAVKTADGSSEIKEVSMKEDDDMSASDFYDVVMSADGRIAIGDMESAVCNLCGLTSSQVASMHIKDYLALSGEVGKHIL